MSYCIHQKRKIKEGERRERKRERREREKVRDVLIVKYLDR